MKGYSLGAVLLLALAARPAAAQSEAILKGAFEGKTVHLKIEMPGAQEGVDLHPGTPNPIDYGQHTGRLKKFGIAYHPGDAAIVTKVHVSGDHIEFQLGAGGTGTMGDDANTTVTAQVAPKTQREKDIETALKTETDPKKKKSLNDELGQLQDARHRDDARNNAPAPPWRVPSRKHGGGRHDSRAAHDSTSAIRVMYQRRTSRRKP